MNDFEVPPHAYGGARALVLLHARQMRAFLATWRDARAAGLRLPEVDDPAYVSLDALLLHVLRAARHYMIWCCEQLQLPDPGIDPAPRVETIEADADGFLAHLLERWASPLAEVPESVFEPQTYPAAWGTPYCVDAMLEHAVMHPLRHERQLQELLAG
jgi:hypothetical protein